MSGIDESRRTFLHATTLGALGFAVAKQAQAASHALTSANPGDAQESVEVLTQVLRLNGTTWRVGIDPGNQGREVKWYEAPLKDALPATVPGVIQSAFPEYHGVAWYWHEFNAPADPHAEGRYWLRFHAVDYLAEVWLNGVKLGGHEGAQEPFSLDATTAMKPGAANLLAVRVLNPTHAVIDGIRLEEVAEGRRDYPNPEDNAYNTGGIIDSVELLITPAVRVVALQVVPDWKTGDVRVALDLHNAGEKPVDGELRLTIAPAKGGESAAATNIVKPLSPGITKAEAVLHVPDHRLWEINDPYLYRVTARIRDGHASGADESSTTCGFRDLRFEDGYFRFNGMRIHLHGALYTVLQYPVMLSVAYDDDLFRRDMLNMKMLGLNIVRITCGAALPARMLEVTDELGLLVCEEHFGARELEPSPFMEERWNESVRQVICRDRNHPSIVMWILLNEVFADNKLLRDAAQSLDLLRSLDQTRLVLLNSGGFDRLAGPGAPDGASVVKQFTLGGTLLLQPGPRGEYSVVRWTCPESGAYTITGAFSIYMRKASAETTTGFQVLLNGKSIFDGALEGNEKGTENAPFTLKRVLAKGDTLDFAQGPGGASADPTAAWRRLSANIRSGGGDAHDMGGEFSAQTNPNGVWRYGYFSPGSKPNAASFELFVVDDPSRKNLGNLSNPGSPQWETHIADIHPYQGFPHTAEIIHEMRSMRTGTPIVLSEFGVCGGQDYPRYMRHYEQLGQENCAEAGLFRKKLDEFMGHWQRFRLDECWAQPEDYFAQSQRTQASLVLNDYNAWLANPDIVASFNSTQIVDAWYHGAGITNYFRELKPGMADTYTDVMSPVRWCLFVNRANLYRGTSVRCEASLLNLDCLKPGQYPVRFQVSGPNATRVFDKTVQVEIPARDSRPEPPFVRQVFSEDIKIDGPSGRYRFLATFERGAAAAGGDVEFFVGDAAEMPPVQHEVVLCGHDPELARWCSSRGIRINDALAAEQLERELILVSGTPPGDRLTFFTNLAGRMARGSAVVFLNPDSLIDSTAVDAESAKLPAPSHVIGLPLRWAPLTPSSRPSVGSVHNWYFRTDQWAKPHPIFEGLPAGGIMDSTFYRDILSDRLLVMAEPPRESVCGAVQTSVVFWGDRSQFQEPEAGLMLSIHQSHAGCFIVNTLRIRENLGTVPAAERLLRNALNYAARSLEQPLAPLPEDFDQQLRGFGYQ
jgi:hypothetical protein